ncbi:MAG: GNAT family N-acetyltransferase [Ilumatobacteraceae bacterium]
MIDPDVRPAAADDVEQLAWLEIEARSTLVDQRGGARWLATHDERGADWGETIDQLDVVVAHIGEVIVGYMVLDARTAVATVDDVYVTPPARELGFGDAMLAASIARAHDRGATHLEGQALPGDRDTKNLYERAAIKARLITVSTPLDAR